MNKAKQIVLSKVQSLKSKAAIKRREADQIEREAEALLKEADKMQ